MLHSICRIKIIARSDGINGVISLTRGDYLGAGLSFAAMIPLAGNALAKSGKVITNKKWGNLIEFRNSQGLGARWTLDGKFIGFVE